MMSRLTKGQLIAFVIVTGISIAIMAAWYVRIPALLGIGRYEVIVILPETGGVYPKSVVTYRGRDVGTVTDLQLRSDGRVQVNLSIDNGVDIPADAAVQVRSASAIGEQYINFVPDGGSGGALEDGDQIEAGPEAMPTSTSELLTTLHRFFASLPRDDLSTTVRELDAAFAGTGDDLATLLDSGMAFQDVADANLEDTVALLESLDPVLARQLDLAPEIRRWTRGLDQFTETLASSDKDLRGLLESGGPVADEVVALVDDLNQPLPRLLTDLSLTGQVLDVYIPATEHVLTVLPAAIEMHYSAFPEEARDDEYPEANLSFKFSANNPATCSTGFEYAGQHRSPKDLTNAPLPQNSWCKVSHEDPRVVRGARNQACPNGGYAATAAGCGLVFQPEVVAAQTGGATVYDQGSGRFMTEHGEYYNVGHTGQQVAASWRDYLIGLSR